MATVQLDVSVAATPTSLLAIDSAGIIAGWDQVLKPKDPAATNIAPDAGCASTTEATIIDKLNSKDDSVAADSDANDGNAKDGGATDGGANNGGANDDSANDDDAVDSPDSITKVEDPEVDAEVVGLGKPSCKVTSYHQNADLYIRIRESAGTFLHYKVCSGLVVAASPKLSDLIDSKKPSIGPDGKLVLDLADPGDDLYGLDIIMSIIHYKFHELPVRPDPDQLYSIARVVEKYDCAYLLVPYMEKWISGLDWHITMKKDSNDDDKTLFLTWVFGEGRWFTHMLSRVAHKATLDDNSVLLDAQGQPWKDQGLPLVILDLITKTRFDSLTKIVQAIDEPLRELMSGNNDTWKFCRSKDTNVDLKQSCQHQQLGSLVSALSIAGLLPFPTAQEYPGSVATLAEKVRAIKVIRFKLPNTLPHLDGHINCGINHEEAVDSTMGEDVHLTEAVIRQLRLRAEKSGALITDGVEDASTILEDLRLDCVHFKQVTEEDTKAEDLEA
ncbi:hypothetical protein C8A00DRAFT_46006 [Chaetomidium leptoderma]|uniref:Nuclear pore protein n=1 Tax=Chaetomidium leptoderma TaxID=669021 RepID=A0AAN6ZSV6_9PEZI|nr:hypothetical protein C8A00DRAFT_46006 [Chaetomidium leptoderma]